MPLFVIVFSAEGEEVVVEGDTRGAEGWETSRAMPYSVLCRIQQRRNRGTQNSLRGSLLCETPQNIEFPFTDAGRGGIDWGRETGDPGPVHRVAIQSEYLDCPQCLVAVPSPGDGQYVPARHGHGKHPFGQHRRESLLPGLSLDRME